MPLAAAFVILALYTYSAGLRAPALIALGKGLMIYIVVLVAVILVPMKLGGYAHVFDVASSAFAAQKSGGLLLKPAQYLPFATLAIGSAMAAFMYPYTLTGIFASKSADAIRKNAVFLPAYTVLLGPIALLGYMRTRRGSMCTATTTPSCRRCSPPCSRRGSSASRSLRSRSARWCRRR